MNRTLRLRSLLLLLLLLLVNMELHFRITQVKYRIPDRGQGGGICNGLAVCDCDNSRFVKIIQTFLVLSKTRK